MSSIERYFKLITQSSSFIDDDKLSTIIRNEEQGELEETDLDFVSAASGNQMSYEEFLRYVHKRSDKNGR